MARQKAEGSEADEPRSGKADKSYVGSGAASTSTCWWWLGTRGATSIDVTVLHAVMRGYIASLRPSTLTRGALFFIYIHNGSGSTAFVTPICPPQHRSFASPAPQPSFPAYNPPPLPRISPSMTSSNLLHILSNTTKLLAALNRSARRA